MAKHLSEDEIRYVVSAETSEAQRHIHDLTVSTKELKREEKQRRDAMIALEAAGKKNTEEYRRLSTEASRYSKSISENNRQIAAYTRSMRTTDMTMTQLKKHAKDLASQLDHMNQSANPKAYEQLAGRLRDVRTRMDELRSRARGVSQEMDLGTKVMGKMKMAVKAFVAVKLAGYLKSVHDNAQDTRAEFQRYEAVLKNTLQSQEKANTAMRMLQSLAKNTPSSMAEWTAAYIKLVNRGIVPTEVELTRLGDIAASQGKSTDQFIEAVLDAMTGENERLKEFGVQAKKNGDTTAYTFKGVTTEVRNSADAIKDYLVGLGEMDGVAGSMIVQMETLAGKQSNLGDAMDDFFNRVGKKMEPFWNLMYDSANKFFSTLSGWFTTYTEQYEAHFDEMVNLEQQLPALMARYEDLSSKTNRSVIENEELEQTIRQIANIVPEAANAFDEYGRIIGISSEKVDAFLVRQRALLKYENAQAIKETEKELKKLRDKQGTLLGQKKRGGKDINWLAGFGHTDIDTSDDAIGEINEELNAIGEKIVGAEARLAKLTGQTLEDSIRAQQQESEARSKFLGMNATQLNEWLNNEQNAADQYRAIAAEILAKKQEVLTGEPDPKNTSSGTKKREKPVDKVALQLADEKYLHEEHLRQLKILYLQQDDENLMSREDYLKKVEEENMDYLRRQLNIAGLDRDQQMSIYQQLFDFKIKLMEEEKAMQKDNVSEGMAALQQQINEENKAKWEQKQKEAKMLEQRQQQYAAFGRTIGSSIGQMIAGQEGALESFGDTMISIIFDVLTKMVMAEITATTAAGTSAIGQATAKSMATPDSILTFGATGTARAAILTGLISTAIAAAQAGLMALLHKRTNAGRSPSRGKGGSTYSYVPGKEEGGTIDVIRQQDGHLYPAADYAPGRRGYISRPTVIVGEGPSGRSREWVASNAAVSNPTVAPVLDLIDRAQSAGQLSGFDLNQALAAHLAGFESGGSISGASVPTITAAAPDAASTAVLQRLAGILESLEQQGIPATVSLSQLDAARRTQNLSRQLGSK